MAVAQRAETFSVREAGPGDRAEIEALIGEMIPGCDVGARWRWLYDGSPGGRALTWLALAPSGEVAGCTSFFPFRMWLDGAELRGALGGDGYIRPAFRRRGLGGLMHDASRLAMPRHRIECMYGSPGAMNVTPLKHGGSRECGTVVRYARPLRSEAMVSKASIVPPALAALTRVAMPISRLIAKRLMPSRRRLAELSPALPHDPRIDEVWAAAAPHLRLSTIRDAAFYTWRFHEAPAQRQPSYVIVDRGRPIGACALELLEHGRVLRIVDVVSAPRDWHTCLRAITAFASDTRAELVDMKLLASDGRARQMWKSLFVERDGKPFLCMIPRDGDRRFVDPERWFYTQADSDLDDHS